MNVPHLTDAEIAQHARRELDPPRALAASDHLLECAECRERLAAARGTPESSPVTYRELADWVDDKLEPIERHAVAQKLAQSAAARAELRDLENFREKAAGGNTVRGVHVARWIWPIAAAALLSAAGLWWKNAAHNSDQRAASLASERSIVEVPEFVHTLRPEPSVLAGEAAKEAGFRLIAPVGTAVEEDTPMLQWTPYPTATSYRIVLATADGDEVLLSKEISADQQSWKPAAPLDREKTFRWEVEALRGDQILAKAPNPPESDARFRIISEAAVAELAQARVDAHEGHMELGLAYARAGLITKAQEEFDALAKADPSSPMSEKLRAALAAAVKGAGP
jgi:hypothetical protein